MTFFLLVAVVLLWANLVLKVSLWIGTRAANGRWKLPIALITFFGLLPLPLVDEIVGGFQYRSLCAEHAAFRMGVQNPEGRTTKVTINPSNRLLGNTEIEIRHSHVEYHDVSSGELVVAFDRYDAEGGFLIKALGISNSNRPLTIGEPFCSPERGKNVRLTMKFSVVN